MNIMSSDKGSNEAYSLSFCALFSFEKISDFATVIFLFLFDKYCSIMN